MLAPTHRDDFADVLETGISPRPAKPGPAALLVARYQIVPFFEPGRAKLLAELRAWADDAAPARARLLHGAGGMGKTRLFIHWCAQLRNEGWRAGFLRKEASRERFAALVADGRPTLVAVDYAELRQGLTGLLQLVAARLDPGGGGRLRMVLLAREIGDWWTALRTSDAEVQGLLDDHAPLALGALAHGREEREEAFAEALKRFAAVDGKEVARGASPSLPPLEDELYDRVLYIHMAALRALEGVVVRAERLLGDMLDHEERFWLTQLSAEERSAARGRKFKEQVARVVVALTLLGGARERAQLRGVMRRVLGAEDEGLELLLRDLYPGGRGERYVNGLEPDLLGEALVHRTLERLQQAGEAKEYLAAVFDGAEEPALETGFVVLGRLSEQYPDEAGKWIAEVLGGDVTGRALPALAAAKALGKKTAHARVGVELARVLERVGTIELAQRLEEAGLPEQTVSLREVRMWVTQLQLVPLPEDAGADALAERARVLNNLGVWQSRLGRLEAALASTCEAVEIRRQLAKEQPHAFLPDLALSLSNLGNRQGRVGQWEAALTSSHEAVEIYRRLAQKQPGAFLAYLALSLNNLGAWQSELGQREEALTAFREAVEIRRKLAQERPDAFLPDLAMSLSNLGKCESEWGHPGAALASAPEAVEIYRRLAQEQPDAFLPDLAMSLNTLGYCQSRSGQREAAWASTREGAKLYRKLAQERPDAFLPDLARNLNTLGDCQSELGQREAALASAQEALNVIWPFFLSLPRGFERLTRLILDSLQQHLKDLGLAPSPELLERLTIFQQKLSA
jgi:tetratricopeptide (TPR) repeat protein